MKRIMYQGAEAVVSLKDNSVIKNMVPKSYRIKELDDKIRKQRTKAEKKLLEKASKIINAPNPFPLREEFNEIEMPYVEGKKLSEHLNDFSLKKQKEILKLVGQETAKLHDNDIIHGDLTTSNLILTGDKVFFIDFGLGFISPKVEDKAVDLHLIKQALEAKHFTNWETLFNEFLKGYDSSKESKKVLERMKAVEKRGRYRH